MAVVPLALAGALLGFLRYNIHPASVFLGDSGACSVGFVLACLCLRGGTMLSAGLAVLVPVVIVGVPLADTLLSIVRRVLRRVDIALGYWRHGGRQGPHPPQAPGPRPQSTPCRPRSLRRRRRPARPWPSDRSSLSSALPRIFLAALLGAAFVGISRLGYDELAVIRKGTILRLYDLPAPEDGVLRRLRRPLPSPSSLYTSPSASSGTTGPFSSTGPLALELGTVVPALVFVTFQLFGLYRGRWRHATLEDLLRPTAAVLLTGAGAALADTLALGGDAPLSFFLVFTLVLLFLANGSRSSYRLLAYWRARASKPGVPVLLFGAGRRGSMAVRELSACVDAPLRAIGFVDNDPEKKGLLLNGIPVLGCFEQLGELIENHGAKGVVVTSPKIPQRVCEEIEETCLLHGIAFFQFHITFEGTLIASRDRASGRAGEGVGAAGSLPVDAPDDSKVTPCR